MQNVANTGLASFRTGSNAERWMRAAVLSAIGSAGLYIWAKDSESAFWTHLLMPGVKRCFVDEEWVERRAVSILRRGKGPFDYSTTSPVLSLKALGKSLDHPIMLGPGFDRNGECIYGCFGLGYSGVEVGSVTPQKQAGNGLPRIFRVKADEAMISRAGNPSRGMAVSSFFMEQHCDWETAFGYPADSRLLGVNVARNKVSTDLIEDARIGVKVFSEHADYVAVNLGSPKLKGDNLIPSKTWLEDLLRSCEAARNRLPEEHRKPILFKLSYDMTEQDKQIISKIAVDKKLDGLIVGNGTVERPGLLEYHYLSRQPGLCYGAPTKEMSTNLIKDLYKRTKGSVLIIGGGGVSSGADALEKIEAGATLVQMNTALMNHGPGSVPMVKRELNIALENKGYDNIMDAVGKAVNL
eukprot:TRINITY_DN6443_c0_g3_i1.p1 TRINITY_DN6443_c0_g3~~TRINITY_DN6443_c0_g3_i1.p1  ORF type:complete len:426 (+),score=74.89 TRINITY_DN6443_c0_g3_i1:50-1279(+)